MLRADELKENQIEIEKGKWVCARPIKDGLKYRVKDAIAVLKGEADAVKFHKQ